MDGELSRAEAARHLESLIRRMLDPDEPRQTRRFAAQALSRTPVPRSLLALAIAAEDDNPEVREEARYGLHGSGAMGIHALTPLLLPGIPDAALAARALGFINHPHSRQVLLPLLTDDRPWVVLETAIGLGAMGEYRAVEALCNSLMANLATRDEAPYALERLAVAAQTLGQLRDPRAVETLCRCLSAADPIGSAAAASLAAIGNPWAIAPLCAALTRALEPRTRQAAAAALAAFHDPKAVRPLCLALGDPISTVKSAAATTLTRFSDECLHHELSEDGEPPLAPYLEQALRSEDPLAITQAARIAGLLVIVSLLPALEWRAKALPAHLTPLVHNARCIIEARIAAVRSRPIPAAPSTSDVRGLPIPNARPDSSAHQPPRIAGQSAFDQES